MTETIPHSYADGWQSCMACYGFVFGLRLVLPQTFGPPGEPIALLVEMGLSPLFIGTIILFHSLSSTVSMTVANNGVSYWCPFFAALGSMLWTMLGLAHGILELRTGGFPSWGVFEFLGGVGLSVATTQRAYTLDGRIKWIPD
jgi:hypothetical protein